MDEATLDQRQGELFETLDLAPAPRALVADYSFGMKKKLALSAALIHAPRLVFLAVSAFSLIAILTVATLPKRPLKA